jgi:hypothetical protein
VTSDDQTRPPLEPDPKGLDEPWPGDGAQAVHEPHAPDPPRKRTVELTTVAVVAILTAAGGFIGGAAWKSSDSPAAAQSVVAGNGATNGTAPTGTASNGAPRFGGYGGRGGFRGGNGGAGFNGGNGAVGQITAIDGDRITIQDAQGGTVVVTASSSTTVDVNQQGTVADLKPGDTVVVQGQRGADGTIAATTIRSGALGGFGGFGGSGGGPGGAPGATTPTT